MQVFHNSWHKKRMIEANVGSIIMLSSVIKPHFVKICLFLVVILLGFNVSVVFLGWPRSKVTGIDSNRQRELGIRDMDSQLHGRFEYDEAFYYDLSEEEDSAELAIFTTTLSETPEPSTTTHENKRWTFSLSTTVMPTTASVPSIATASRKPPTRVSPHAPARAPPRATASKPKPNPSHKSNPYMRTCTCRWVSTVIEHNRITCMHTHMYMCEFIHAHGHALAGYGLLWWCICLSSQVWQ